jgi:hypothetical protein
VRPNDAIEDPLLTPAEEIAWRTRELASLPVGACYWYTKDRPYKARRIQVLRPVPLPFRGMELEKRLRHAMAEQKGIATETPATQLQTAFDAAIAERSARRNAAAGITENAAPMP